MKVTEFQILTCSIFQSKNMMCFKSLVLFKIRSCKSIQVVRGLHQSHSSKLYLIE
uniref:Uncharacterized protein n=1 Tax=Arundo donax TaxID=35708 RepID=A0A0A9HKM3_ARUDO